ncbi:MAG: leucyl aminopeptidase family protein, partial [Thermoflexales bacterium]|nr:leucyl aminopeptidase family protein [Thermoflexales bacterium]
AAALGCKTVATIAHGAGLGGLDARIAAQATVEGALLGGYEHLEQKSRAESRAVGTLLLVEADAGRLAAVRDGAHDGEIIANAQNAARTLINRPPNVLYPETFAAHCVSMAKRTGLKVTVLTEKEMTTHKMGGILNVNAGSKHPPRFVILEHIPRGHAREAPLVLIGKGVCFDTGGYSLKTADGMIAMKGDMSGAAAVAGALEAIAGLKVPRHVIGVMPLVENRVSDASYLPSDVLTMMNGMTVEIISTDAEGRLILADALHWVKRYKPSGVVDIATLTGVASMAMGDCMAATAHTNDEAWSRAVIDAGALVGERIWPMPLYPEYGDPMRSDTADFKNSAGNRFAGLGVSGWFLQQFTLDDARAGAAYRWTHVDMAPMDFANTTSGYHPRGGMGFGVRTFVALSQAEARAGSGVG